MLDAVLTDPEKASLVGVLVIAVVAFVRGWIIPAPTVDRMMKNAIEPLEKQLEREIRRGDRWEQLATTATRTTKQMADVAKQVIEQ